jgi:hypothetical protein
MAAETKELILGDNCNIYLGTILIGCAKKIKVSTKYAKLDATCIGTGNTKKFLPGKEEITFSLDGISKQYSSADAATNVGVKNWFQAGKNKTLVTLVFRGTETGDDRYTIVGYTEGVDMEQSDGEIGTYSTSGWANSLVIDTVPA